jgi:cytochrome c oxidase cbb3-type subunit 3
MNENQEDRLLDHNYDGIQEYDNPMPFWWKALFWVTVVFSVVYIAFYHGGPGLSVEEEYGQAMIAHLDLQAAQMGEVTEEALAELAADSAKMTGAAQVFVSKCSQCHGQLGEGNIGPNLTDEYWLHGQGALVDIYDVVYNGVPAKGMLAWKNQLRAAELLVVSAYVGTLQGTDPPNAKAPQGVIPEPGDEIPAEDPQPET